MDIDEINDYIQKLKGEKTSWQGIERLAALCTVRDELEQGRQKQGAVEPPHADQVRSALESKSASEFMRAASDVPLDELLGVLDEHMSAVKMVYPMEYKLVIRKLEMLV